MAIIGDIGSTAGGIGGGALGSSIAGPLGGIIGSQIGSSLGGAIGGGVESVFGGGSGDKKQVQRVDQNQVARLREIDRTRKEISEGRDPLTRSAISEIKATGETTKGQLAKFSGGDVGGTISSFLRAQRNTGKGINDRFSQSQGRIPFFENLSTQLGNRISQRKLELDVHDADQQSAEIAQGRTNRNLNLSGIQASSLVSEGLAGLLKGGPNNPISNVAGGGQQPLLGQSPGGFGGGLLDSLGGGTGQAGGGGAFGQGIAGANGPAFGGFGGGNPSFGGFGA